MNKKFEIPELEIIRFEDTDVIATSTTDEKNESSVGGGTSDTEEE